MLIDDLGKKLQECPVEPFHYSIWLWMAYCSSGIVDIQLLAAYHWEQIRLEVPSSICVQLQWDIVM